MIHVPEQNYLQVQESNYTLILQAVRMSKHQKSDGSGMQERPMFRLVQR